MAKIELSPAVIEVIASLKDKDRRSIKKFIDELSRFEIPAIIGSPNVKLVSEDRKYYFIRASAELRIIFQIENGDKLIILDIARQYRLIKTKPQKNFFRLLVVSVIALIAFIFLGTLGSKLFIAIVATPTIFDLTDTPTATATSTPTPKFTPTTSLPTYTPYPTNTVQPTATSTPSPIISSEVMNISGWIFGTIASCLGSIIAVVGLISTTLITWVKEVREAKYAKLENQKNLMEVEKLKVEVENMKNQKVSKTKRR